MHAPDTHDNSGRAFRQRSRPRLARAAGMIAVALACLPAEALYKVVGPDGKVTYTDRPDTSVQQGKVMQVNPATGAGNDASPLPLELRQVAQRYPVSLYTGPNCQPCQMAKDYLTQRGIPFAEKQVLNNDDTVALERITGGREAPTMTLGSQVVRGFSSDMWGSYLDAAGYPKQSRLPLNYQQPAPTPLVARQAPPAEQPTQRLEPSSSGVTVDDGPPPSPSGIRF